jgi:hypothetical protein
LKIIPAATTVALTPEERQVLEALAGSRKAEARMRDRAVGEHWVHARDGLEMAGPLRQRQEGGSDETGDRGNEPKYGSEHGQRILALLDTHNRLGFQLDSAVVGARVGDIHEQYIWRFLRAQKIDLAGRRVETPRTNGVMGITGDLDGLAELRP